jgi:hypothetical protein
MEQMTHVVSRNVGIAEYGKYKIIALIILKSGKIHKMFEHLQVNLWQIAAE